MPITDVGQSSSSATPSTSTILPTIPATTAPSHPTIPTPSFTEKSLLDMTSSERSKLMKRKKRRAVKPSASRTRTTPPQTSQSTEPEAEPLPKEPSDEPPAKRLHTSENSEPRTQQPADPEPHTQHPADPEPHTQQPTSPSPDSPTISSQAREAFAAMTLWPEDPTSYPFELYENFLLPHDQDRFSNHSAQELMYALAMHQGRANATVAQMLRRLSKIDAKEKELEAEVARLQVRIQALTAGLEKEKGLHEETASKCQELKLELDTAKQQIAGLTEQRKQLLVDRSDMKTQIESLKKSLSDFEAKYLSIHQKWTDAGKTIDTLEKEKAELQNRCSSSAEAIKQQAIAEYKVSAELSEAVMAQFGDGYQTAKAEIKEKLIAAGVDPSVLDSSEDESEADADTPTS